MTYHSTVLTANSDLVAPGAATLLLVLLTYLAGRVHQFFKQTDEREQAYRDGYNTATKSLFSLATRIMKGALPVSGPPTTTVRVPTTPAGTIRGFASVEPDSRRSRPPRHRAIGRRKPSLSDTERFEDWPGDRTAA